MVGFHACVHASLRIRLVTRILSTPRWFPFVSRIDDASRDTSSNGLEKTTHAFTPRFPIASRHGAIVHEARAPRAPRLSSPFLLLSLSFRFLHFFFFSPLIFPLPLFSLSFLLPSSSRLYPPRGHPFFLVIFHVFFLPSLFFLFCFAVGMERLVGWLVGCTYHEPLLQGYRCSVNYNKRTGCFECAQ